MDDTAGAPPAPTPYGERERALDAINGDFDRRILEQATSANGIDTKVTFLLGATAIAVQVFLGLDRQEGWAAAAFIAFVVTVASGLTCIWPRGHPVVPDPRAVDADYWRWVREGVPNVRELVLGKLVGIKAEAIQGAGDRYRRKVRWWRTALVAFAVALALSGVSILEAEDGTRPGRVHPRHAGRTAQRSATS